MKKLSKLLVVISVLFSSATWAVDPIYTGYFSDLAIKGYDTVAYFTQGEPVKGKDKFSTEYQGARWLFSSQQHLDLFVDGPQKYAPQYGGYCAYAVSQNDTASIQPDLFTIVDDKLYLNYSDSVNKKWSADKAGFIKLADQHWPGLIE